MNVSPTDSVFLRTFCSFIAIGFLTNGILVVILTKGRDPGLFTLGKAVRRWLQTAKTGQPYVNPTSGDQATWPHIEVELREAALNASRFREEMAERLIRFDLQPTSFDQLDDNVLSPTALNSDVYEKIEPLVQGVIEGHNVYAIGTGSGKSYTTFDSPDAIASSAGRHIFEQMGVVGYKDKYHLHGHAIEVYMGKSADGYGRYLSTSKDLGHSLDNELKKRRVHAIDKNAESSRGHFILTI